MRKLWISIFASIIVGVTITAGFASAQVTPPQLWSQFGAWLQPTNKNQGIRVGTSNQFSVDTGGNATTTNLVVVGTCTGCSSGGSSATTTIFSNATSTGPHLTFSTTTSGSGALNITGSGANVNFNLNTTGLQPAGTYVTSVGATGNLSSTGGTTPNITITNNPSFSGTLTVTGTSTLATTTITSLKVNGNSISGTNTGDVTYSGQNYLTLTGQALTGNAVDLSGGNATGILAAGRFPALTGDVITSAGSLATTLKNTGPGASSCTNCSITIDAQGRTTAISNNQGFSTTTINGLSAINYTFSSGSGISISTSAPGTITFLNTAAGGGATTTIQSGAGGTIVSGPSFIFSSGTPDTNIGLIITGSGSTITLQPTWSGVLPVSRGGIGTTTLGSLTSGSTPNLTVSGGQNVLIGTSTIISLGAGVISTVSTGTSGTIFNISTSTNSLTLNLPFASAANTGQLQATDWTTFNNKVSNTYASSTFPSFVYASSTFLSFTYASSTYAILNANQTFTGTNTFTGTSTQATTTVPTRTTGDNTTNVANTAFVTTAIANAIAGVNPAVAVQAATVSASDTSGLTYNNGVSGIGATFTGTNNTALTIDGFTFTTLGQRLLVKNDTQSPSGAFNGIYYVTQVQTAILPPILTRALDYDQPSDINNTGAIPVISGTVNGTTSWILTSTVNTVGTDPLTYTKFSLNPSTIVTSVSGAGSIISSGGQTPTLQLQNLTTNDILFGQGNSTIATSSLFTFNATSGFTNSATTTLATTTINGTLTVPSIANCNSTQFLQITSGLFGCGTPSGSGGGSGAGTATGTPNYVFTNYPSTTTTNFGVNTSSPIAQLSVVGISGSITPEFVVASSSNKSNLEVFSNGNVEVGNGSSTPVNPFEVTSTATNTPAITIIGTNGQPTFEIRDPGPATSLNGNAYAGLLAGATASSTAIGNTAFGWSALKLNTASWETAFGNAALANNTSGIFNTGVGDAAMNQNTTGGWNTGVGEEALNANTTGNFNVAIGNDDLFKNTVGSNNTSVGTYSMQTHKQGDDNVSIGYEALNFDVNSTSTTAVGYLAGMNSSSTQSNTLIGNQSGMDLVTGSFNTVLGSFALDTATSSQQNVAIGYNSLASEITGNNNTSLGLQSGFSNLGSGSVFLGSNAGFSETGSNKLYIADNKVGALIYGDFANGYVNINATNTPANLFVEGTSTTPTANILQVASSSGTSYLTVSATGTTTVTGAMILPVAAASVLGTSGQIAVSSVANTLTFNSGGTQFYLNPVKNFNFEVQFPNTNEDDGFMVFNATTTITKVLCVNQGTTDNTQINFVWGNNRTVATSSATSRLFSSFQNCNGTSTPTSLTSFASTTINSLQDLRFITGSTASSSDLTITVYGTENQ